MTNLNVLPAAKSSYVVDPLNVLAWVDDDRLLIKDRTKHGLHRRVIARKDSRPQEEWLQAVSIHDQVPMERIIHRYVQYGE